MVQIPNSFGLRCEAKTILALSNLGKLPEHPYIILGSCSNLILPPELNATCIFADDTSIYLIKETSNHFYISVGAATNWHGFVELCIRNKWYGLENLILIPGTVGAAPVQNIGAYGTEVADKIHKINSIHLPTLKKYEFSKHECNFSYRDSIFKTELSNHIITKVEFKLEKTFHLLNEHENIKKLFDTKKNVCAHEVANAIKKIRLDKLPAPEITGNAGSFFKNPIVPANKIFKLDNCIPKFKLTDGRTKLSAAALIEQAGLKGLSVGGAAVSQQHALVIINEKNASYYDVITLAKIIQNKVYEKYGIVLETEVRIIDKEFEQQNLEQIY